MTASPDPSPNEANEPRSRPSWQRRLLIGSAIAGGTLLVGGTLGFLVGATWLRQNLPSLLENQLSTILNRDVEVGEVERLTLTQIRLGPSAIPPTETDADYVNIDSIDLQVQLLPLLSGTLYLELTLNSPTVYIDQNEADGEWISLEIDSQNSGELPFDLDASVILDTAEVILKPYGSDRPLSLLVNGDVAVLDSPADQRIRYDLTADVGTGKLLILGETLTASGQTQVNVRAQELAIADIQPVEALIELPVNFIDGIITANLDAEIPPFAELRDTLPEIRGTAQVQGVTVMSEAIASPVSLTGQLRFLGQSVELTPVEVRLDDLVATVRGLVDIDDGVDLAINVPRVSVAEVQALLDLDLPIALKAVLTADVAVTGEFTDPQIAGEIATIETAQVDRLRFDQIDAEFAANLQGATLTALTVLPQAGGRITAQGDIDFGEGLLAEEFDPQQAALTATAQIDGLPLNAIAAAYDATQPNYRYGNLNAQAEVVGTLADLNGGAQWAIANAFVPATGNLAGRGEIDLARNQLTLQNTVLNVGNGTVRVEGSGNLDSTAWQVEAVANNLDVSGIPALQTALDQTILASTQATLPRLDATLAASGVIAPLLDEPPAGTINLEAFTADLGEQFLRAAGQINLQRPGSAWQIGTDLTVQARSRLETLPAQILRQQLPPDVQADVRGLAEFSGQLQATDLLANLTQPGNLTLEGSLSLLDFAVNQVAFEPLQGPINLDVGDRLAFDLRSTRGGSDRLAAELSPCALRQCLAPYLPDSVALVQGTGDRAIRVFGDRQGAEFAVDLQNFELGLLGVAPAVQIGLTEAARGQVTGDATINLITLETTGSLTIDRPRLGYLAASRVQTDFAYADGIARLTDGLLDLGESRYSLSGLVNLNTQEIEADLDVVTGYVQDLIQLLGWFSVADVQRGLQPPDYAEAIAVNPDPVGNPRRSLAAQMRLLNDINLRLQAIAQARQDNRLPTELDLAGQYDGSAQIDGTLSNPVVTFDLAVDELEWHPVESYVTFVPPKITQKEAFAVSGRCSSTPAAPAAELIERIPVLCDGRSVMVGPFIAEGRYRNGILTVDPITLEFQNAIAQAEIQAVGTQLEGEFSLSNLTVDSISEFVSIPVDLDGVINVSGTLGGSLTQPRVQGDLAFVDVTLNNRAIAATQGEFTYGNQRLEVVTTEDSLVFVNADLPVPLRARSSNPFQAEIGLDPAAVEALSAFTRDQIAVTSGDVSVQLLATGDLNRSNLLRSRVSATGLIDLDAATFATPYLTNPLILNGQLALDTTRLRANEVSGEFAGGSFLLAGVLPILFPLGQSDPDFATPLTLAIANQEFDLDGDYGIYNGEVNSQILVRGSALAPLLSGFLELEDGRFSLPDLNRDRDNRPTESAATSTPILSASRNPLAGLSGPGFPFFQDFRVSLVDNVGLDNRPLYSIRAEGDVLLNGPLSNLQPNGVIELTRARVNLFSSRFYLSRAETELDNTIRFSPDTGLFNPDLNIQVETTAFETFGNRRSATSSQEIREDIIPNVRPEEIDIQLTVDGPLSQLMPSRERAIACTVRDSTLGLTEQSLTTTGNLDVLENCIEIAALSGSPEDSDFLRSPIVELSSTPDRSDAQIVALLGDQFINFAEELEAIASSGDESEILEFAVSEYVVRPFLRDVDEFTASIGREIGLSDLRIYPVIRATRRLDDNSSVELDYDYEFGQVRVIYRTRF